jgi:hydrogenase expression/formation protein HypC
MCLGVPGRVVDVLDAAGSRALVDVHGAGRREVSCALLAAGGESAQAGDWVIVHLGLAMSVISAAEAQQVIADLQRLEDLYSGLAPGAAGDPVQPGGTAGTGGPAGSTGR